MLLSELHAKYFIDYITLCSTHTRINRFIYNESVNTYTMFLEGNTFGEDHMRYAHK